MIKMEGTPMHKRAPTPRPAPACIAISDEELASEAERSGFTVAELRAYLAKHPITENELDDVARFAKRVREGREPLTHTKARMTAQLALDKERARRR
jgi:hypothetical protein